MNVLQFASYSADSEYMRNLGLGLSNKGINLTCGMLFDDGDTEPDWIKRAPSAKYFCLKVKSRKGFLPAIFKLAQVLRREKIDILQTHLYEASLVGLLAAKLARTPLRILTRHHTDQAHMIGRKLPIAVDRWEAKEADRVVVLSNAVRNFMVAADGVDEAKIEVIYQGFNFEKFSASEDDRKSVRIEFGMADDDFVIGTFGSFFPTKGHRFLVEAAIELIAEIPNLKLLFVGAGGDRNDLEHQITTSGLAGKVVFAGFRQDVNACMKAVDVVVHPSLSEAFCQVLVETMSVGTPLISTDVGGANEVIDNGNSALLIPPESPAAIVEAVTRLYKDMDFAKKIAVAGQKSVRERFTLEKMIDRQVECYERWLGAKRNGGC
jgi:glycosyltransferase involved in cell wall biosynthesis